MKRNIKMLIVAVVVLGILAAGYFALPKLLSDKSENAPGKEDGALPVQTDGNDVGVDYLIDEETDNVESVTFNNGEITYTVINGENPSIEGYSSHILDNTNLHTALFNGTSIVSSRKLEKVEELSKYGLDKEDKYVSVKLKDGTEKKMLIGNPTYIDGEYYAMTVGSEDVYIISEYTAKGILKHPDEFRSLNVANIDNTTISEIAVKRGEDNVLDLKYEKTDTVEGQQLHTYRMNYPYSGVEANVDSINTLCQAISSVSATKIVEENPADLSKYGLDKPYVLTVKDANKKSTVKMGEYSEDGYVYVMKDDVPVVFEASCSFYENVKNLNADEFVDRFIHLFNIKEVASITVSNSEKKHNIEIKKKSEDDFEYKINGKVKVKETFTPVYTSIIGMTAYSFIDTMPESEEYCKIKFVLNDKTEKEYTYYVYDDRYLAVKADSGMMCLVTKDNAKAIFDGIEK